MRIDRIDPGAEVRWTCVGDFPFWEATIVHWRMQPNPDGPGTRLIFSHTGWPEGTPEHSYASVSYTWGQIVARLHGTPRVRALGPVPGRRHVGR